MVEMNALIEVGTDLLYSVCSLCIVDAEQVLN